MREIRQTGIAAIGECMLELRGSANSDQEQDLKLGFGGDTLNTALYLARLGVPTEYVTALGDDRHSQWLLDQWTQEGVGTTHVQRLRNKRPGLYWITTDSSGERSFDYWRGEAAARDLLEDEAQVAALTEALAQQGMIYFSGITLSIYAPLAQQRFFELIERIRDRGVVIGFDGNYRPVGWQTPQDARVAFERAYRLAHIALPTFDDEQALFGDGDPQETLARLADWGAEEVAIKLGPDGCLLSGRLGATDVSLNSAAAEFTASILVPTQRVTQPVDTTAAGDSFSAGYLAARFQGATPEQAARAGNSLAGAVIMYPGAIMPLQQMPRGFAQTADSSR